MPLSLSFRSNATSFLPRNLGSWTAVVDDNHRRWTQDYHQSGGGYELAFSGVIFALIGLWLDRRFGTVPFLTITLTVVGFGGAVANIYYRYKREMERHDREAEARRNGP
jgi:F0F1-type ATP synthase assembly protein I